MLEPGRPVVPVRVLDVRLELPVQTPVVLLQELDGPRVLPIYINSPEATSLAKHLAGEVPRRPLTHDLFVETLLEAGVLLDGVVVTEVVDDTFYAELHLRSSAGRHVVSARPSDGVNLAVRAGAPLVVDAALFDELAKVLDLDPGAAAAEVGSLPDDDLPDAETDEPEELVDEFSRFLDNISPEDFA